ncbi:MAG TPA: hypothetical protein VGG72_09100 [Bryobacteraceae bacterium]|jgi:hypothetical protein
MTIAKLSTLEVAELGTIHDVLDSPGPCVTLVLPPYHAGERAESGAAFLKASLHGIAQQFVERKVPRTLGRDLLEPLEQLAHESAGSAGSHLGCAILRSQDVFCQFRLTQPARPSLTVAGCFAVRRLIDEFLAPAMFYILALSKDSVSLLRCAGAQLETVPLPGGAPMTLEEALALEPPDHDLENRSASSGSEGGRRRIRFGTGSGREAAHAHLADFYKIVDRGIHKLLHEPEIPLLLAGVDEDVAAYRAVNTYRCLAQGSLHGSSKLLLQTAEILMYARSLLSAEERQRQAGALKEDAKHLAADRMLTDPYAILNAAFNGRVRQLYVAEDAENAAVFERKGYRTWGKEDLLNLAAVRTMLDRGRAFELPRSSMPGGAAAIAMLRY